MGKLIRFVNQGIKHFFIVDGEDLGDGCHEFKNCLPDSFTDCQFVAVLSHLSEEFTDSLVVHETLHGREDVVLECHEGRACYLRCKVGRLAFSKPQQSFTFLEDDLLRPAPGVILYASKNPKSRSVVSSPLHGPRLLRRMKNKRT